MHISVLKELLADKPIPELMPALASDTAFQSLLPVIDAELSRRSQQLQRLQTFRNSYASPATRLPLECISEILSYLAFQSEDTAYDLWWRRHTLVCRRWREAALTTPKLWSFADLTVGLRSFSVLELNRKRAQRYPLSVKLAVRPGNKRYWADGHPLFWDSRRLRALHVDVLPKQAQAFINRILPDPHPVLESLRVISRFRDFTGRNRRPTPEDVALVFLSDEFLLERTPALRRLSLLDISFSWSALRNLTRLTAAWSQPWVEKFKVDWSMRDIVEALGRCPELTHMLMRSLPVAAPDDPLPTVHLPFLRDVDLTGFAESCGQLIMAMNMPGTTMLTIDAIHSGDAAEALFPLAAGLRRHYGEDAPIMQTLTCGIVEVEGRGKALYFNAYGDGKVHSIMDYNQRSESLLTLYTYPRTQDAIHRVINLTFPAVPFHNINLLDWRGTHGPTAEARATVIENLPALHTIAVRLFATDVDILLETLALVQQREIRFNGRICLDTELIDWVDQYARSGDVSNTEEVQTALDVFDRIVAHMAAAKLAGRPWEAIMLEDAPRMLVEGILAADVARHLSVGFLCNGVFHASDSAGNNNQ